MEQVLPSLVALSGYGFAGKDTAYEYGLRDHGYERVAFADALKIELCSAFGVDLEELNNNKQLWRPMMVALGELRRQQDPRYWIDRVFNNLEIGRRYCITDARYLNECQEVLSMGGRVYLIDKPPRDPANETEYESIQQIRNDIQPVVIVNDSTKAVLGDRLWAAVSSNLRKK